MSKFEYSDLKYYTIMEGSHENKCRVCGNETKYIDYCYECAICSTECYNKLTNRLIDDNINLKGGSMCYQLNASRIGYELISEIEKVENHIKKYTKEIVCSEDKEEIREYIMKKKYLNGKLEGLTIAKAIIKR